MKTIWKYRPIDSWVYQFVDDQSKIPESATSATLATYRDIHFHGRELSLEDGEIVNLEGLKERDHQSGFYDKFPSPIKSS